MIVPAGQLYGRMLSEPPRDAALRRADGTVVPLPLDQWLGPIDDADAALLERVEEPVIDIGCGPGRHVAALRDAVGIDLSPEAVSLARERGAHAMLGSVFDHVPGTGSWRTALLLDGNVGIGGRPAVLLARAAELLAPGGTVVAELDPPGTGTSSTRVRLEAPGVTSDWFPWAHVGADAIAGVARAAGLRVDWTLHAGGRWFAGLGTP
jgi:SAM-dependent methyltransferase